MEKEKITTLFLDIGGVLLSNGWGHEFRYQAAAKFNLDITEMEVRHKRIFEKYEEGKLTLDEYLGEVVFYQKRSFTHEAFRDYMFSLTTPHPDMIDLFKKLKEKYRLKIAVVSNEAREMNEYRINKFQLDDFVDFFISSCYVHIRKPDAAIFRMALDIAHERAEQVIYIEDLQKFIDVAAGLDIRGIRHTDYLSTTKALAEMGLVL